MRPTGRRAISRAQIIESSRELSQALAAIASGVFSPDDPRRYAELIGGLYDHDWFMVAADFDAYAAAQRSIDERWSDRAGLERRGGPQCGAYGLVFVRPHHPRICQRHLGLFVKPPAGALEALLQGRHGDPFSLLGVHAGPGGTFARVWIPGAERAEAHRSDGRRLGALTRIDKRGLFEGKISGPPRPVKYKAQGYGAQWWVTDAYSFGPVLGPVDDFLMAQGTHLRLYDKMGAHLISHEGAAGIHFAVWAPNARRVSVVGDFNDWDGRRHVMRRRRDIGVWEIFIPDIGARARLQIRDRRPRWPHPPAEGRSLRLRRRVAAGHGIRHHRAARSMSGAMTRIAPSGPQSIPGAQPISIYEVHAGSMGSRLRMAISCPGMRWPSG